MKKFFSILGCALLAVVGVAFAGCKDKNPQTPPSEKPAVVEHIRLHSGEVKFSDNGQAFSNNSNLTINRVTTRTYSLQGDASFMSVEQADEFWQGVANGLDAYVVLDFDLPAGKTLSYVSSDGTKTFTNEEETDDVLTVIWRIVDSEVPFVCTVDDKDYTINFNSLNVTLPVSLADEAVELGNASFENSSTLRIGYKGINVYNVSGTANSFSEEQALAFWGDASKIGNKYIVINVEFLAGTKIMWSAEDSLKQLSNTTEEDDVLTIIYDVTNINANRPITIFVEDLDQAEAASPTILIINVVGLN